MRLALAFWLGALWAAVLMGFEIRRFRNNVQGRVTMTPTPAQLTRIRETISATVADWLTDYGITPDKTHTQLENRIVAAMVAMAQGGVITINQVAERPEGGV